MLRFSFFICVLLLYSGVSGAQSIPDPLVPQGENLKVPDGWEFRLDKPDASITLGDSEDADLYFVNMTPGWHITTGPRAIFYHPEAMMEGDFSFHSDIHLFNPNGRNREGFGVFFGGNNLQADEQSYIYFLIRNTGDFLVKSRKGDDLSVIIDWTPSDALVLYDNEEESSVLNRLAVEVAGNSMKFYINGEQVGVAEKNMLAANGIVGLRVNHSVNLHVEDFGTGLD